MTRRGPRGTLLAVTWVAWIATACVPATTSPTVPPTTAVGPTVSAAAPTEPSATAPAASTGVAIDPSLLGVLPPDVYGFRLNESKDVDAQAARNPLLSLIAIGFGSGLAADPASGDLVVAVVVALRPGLMSDATFRTWRDSFDVGVCSQAGGVTGHAEAQLGGRTVYIGTCAGGVHTYHVWLPGSQRLVSLSAVGERRFGERLIEGIRP